jgi:hypothetical protein
MARPKNAPKAELQSGDGEMDSEMKVLRARFVPSAEAAAHYGGGQTDSEEQRSYYAANHERASQGLQPFDGIDDYRRNKV